MFWLEEILLAKKATIIEILFQYILRTILCRVTSKFLSIHRRHMLVPLPLQNEIFCSTYQKLPSVQLQRVEMVVEIAFW